MLLVASLIAVLQTPLVALTIPSPNENNVAPSSDIAVTFDVDMNAATLTTGTVVVTGLETGRHPITITYDAPSRTVTLDPANEFRVGEPVLVELSTGVEALDGSALDGHAFGFRIAAAAAPATFPTRADLNVCDGTTVLSPDVDNDGDADIVAVCSAGGGPSGSFLTVSLGNGDGTFAASDFYAAGSQPYSIVAMDLNGDAFVDLVAGGLNDFDLAILINNGDGTFAEQPFVGITARPFELSSADFNSDGAADLLVAPRFGRFIFVSFGNGDGTFAAFTPYAVSDAGSETWSAVAADLDGDGALDLAATDTSGDAVSVLLNAGDGTFGTYVAYPTGVDPTCVVAADMDNDGDVDLATTGGESAVVSVLLNSGAATFGGPTNYPVDVDPLGLVAGDLDGDGNIDLASAHFVNEADGNGLAVLLNNGPGTFAGAVPYAIGDRAWDVVASDLDGDGDLDLAAAHSDGVTVLFNEMVVAVPGGEPVIAHGFVSRSMVGSTPPYRADFVLPGATGVSASVFGVGGAHLRTLITDARFDVGRHSLTWDGRLGDGNLAPAGVYFVRLATAWGESNVRALVIR